MLLPAVSTALLLLVTCSEASLWSRNNGASKKPNFVYIITDDQDALTATPEIMPKTAKWFSLGSNYTSFYSPISLCCPSRVSFLTSQFAHNHNVTDVAAPYGGFPVYCAGGKNGRHLPSWLQDAGYSTFYTGKLMNGNTVKNAHTLPVQGFNGSALLLDPWTYVFYNASYSHDGGPAQQEPGVYSTDSIRDKGLGYIDRASKNKKQPFFIGIAPIAPHSQANDIPGVGYVFDPPIPAKRHENMFSDAIAPRGPSFNPDVASGVSWVGQLDKLNQSNVEYLDYFYRQRLRSLQAVDELVDAVFTKLQKSGLLENTYVVYTADNAFSIGQHRRQPSKGTGYEEDIRVPFLVRGPGVDKGVQHATHSVPDISATFVHLAGASPAQDLDGKVMPWGAKGAPERLTGTSTHQIAEFWVRGPLEGNFSKPFPAGKVQFLPVSEATGFAFNNTYRTLRVKETGNDWMYSVWCTAERELYNMTADGAQMHNLVADLNSGDRSTYFSSSASQNQRIASRMDALLLYLKTCKGVGCRTAWDHLFPYGEATTLKEALDPKFDKYFDRLPKVQLQGCDNGYRLEQEFPYWTTDLPYFAALDAPNANKRDFIALGEGALGD